MKPLAFPLLLVLLVMSCKNEPKSETTTVTDYSKETLDVTTSIYPEHLTKVFDAHGGIDLWKSMKSLEYTQQKPEGKEVTLTNLLNRKALIDAPNYSIGFDGKQVWLLNKTEQAYKGYDPKYGYNLMFYFYAMPFILSDDGINYSETEPLVFEGVTYPGIKITYQNGVGETPEDQYLLFYNPNTYVMEWLGYTVNFVPGIDTTEFHFRRYNDWQTINGLLVPKSITGYGYKDDKPTTPKAPNVFTDVKISTKAPDASLFEKPEKGNFVK
ncbi:DUF6503 family protein [Olleya aquimaris]|uniref:Threonine synthase n=1 Tax=Olleya aquimaris TaxID=639310 RepID=A0A327R8J0_9FLAO|nr:DUF6503 family protein [Olleya aquimaris]RAJ13216.1 hypothetical protein LY08_02116 [Olleya aquimaris]